MMLAVVASCCYFPKLGVLVGLLMLALCLRLWVYWCLTSCWPLLIVLFYFIV